MIPSQIEVLLNLCSLARIEPFVPTMPTNVSKSCLLTWQLAHCIGPTMCQVWRFSILALAREYNDSWTSTVTRPSESSDFKQVELLLISKVYWFNKKLWPDVFPTNQAFRHKISSIHNFVWEDVFVRYLC